MHTLTTAQQLGLTIAVPLLLVVATLWLAKRRGRRGDSDVDWEAVHDVLRETPDNFDPETEKAFNRLVTYLRRQGHLRHNE